ADLVIHDAQFTAEEYPQKIGWGHSTVEYALALCRAANAKRVCFTHHDPSRDDDGLDRILAKARAAIQSAQDIEGLAAIEGAEVTIEGDRRRPPSTAPNETAVPAAAGLGDPLIVLDVTDRSAADTLLNAAYADQIKVFEARSEDDVIQAIAQKAPSMI